MNFFVLGQVHTVVFQFFNHVYKFTNAPVITLGFSIILDLWLRHCQFNTITTVNYHHTLIITIITINFTYLISKLPLTILTRSQFTEILCTMSSCPVKFAKISTSLKLSPVHQISIIPLSDAKANRFSSSHERSVQPASVEAQQLQCLLSGAYMLSGAWSGVLNNHNEPFQ